MKKFLSAVLVAMCIVCSAVMTASADCDSHSYDENGFCTNEDCGAYQPAVLTTDKYDVNNDDEKDDVYEISNIGQLYWFAGLVNGTLEGVEQNTAANAVVLNNLYLNGSFTEPPTFAGSMVFNSDANKMTTEQDLREWTPIGKDAAHQYTGVFSGNGSFTSGSDILSICGLYMNDRLATYAGLFGYVGETGKVMYVTLDDSFICGQNNIGGICGYNKGTLYLCENNSRVCSFKSSAANIGGVCGWNSGTIDSCYNVRYAEDTDAVVEAWGCMTSDEEYINIGGVCGWNSGTINHCYNMGKETTAYVRRNFNISFGGVCGYNKGSIKDCRNLKDINIEYFYQPYQYPYGMAVYAGGFVGKNIDGGNIEKCYNEAKLLYCTGERIYEDGTYDHSLGIWLGGFAGLNNTASITNCYNTGDIEIDSTGLTTVSDKLKDIYIGGFANNSDSSDNTKLLNCHTFGNVKADESELYTLHIGGIYGTGCGSTITNCYYKSDSYGEYSIASAKDSVSVKCGKTANQFASGEVTYLLNGSTSDYDNVWYQNVSEGGSKYPCFSGGIVYQTTPCKTYTNDGSSLEKGHGIYANGFCPDCGAYQAAVLNDDGVYEISNAGQLYWFAGLVNGDSSVCDYDEETNSDGTTQNKAANAILTDNIILNANLLKSLKFDTNNKVTNGTSFKAWTPIGNYSNMYKGTFDGNNKTISGLYLNDATTSYAGLFGSITSGCEINNLGVTDIYINANKWVGGLCGYVYGANSENPVTINNCYTIGTVGKTNYIGGLCGYIYGSLSNSVMIENCYSKGTVNVAVTKDYDTNMVGGFCGYIFGMKSNSVVIDSCYSTSDVKAIGDANQVTLYMGGFSGDIANSSSDKTYIIIDNCYTTSDITADTTGANVTYILGGFCGYNAGTVKNSYSTGTITTSTSSSTDFVKNNNGTSTNCYYLAAAETAASNGITGKTAAQFASGEVAYLLNGSISTGDSLAWGQTLTGESADKYPALKGKTVYQQASGNKYANSLITTAKNTEGAPSFDADTVMYDKDGNSASDFVYDKDADVTTVYVKIDGAETGVKPVITISGDAGNIESQTWTAVDGTNIYYAQFIGDFSQFGTIKVTYNGAEDVTIDSASASEDE